MKKISVFVMMVALLTVFTFSACEGSGESSTGGESTENGTTEETPAPENADTAEEAPAAESAESDKIADSGTLGDYTCVIKDFAIVKDWEDKDALLVNFDFTNNSEDSATFMMSILTKAFQDGVELETTFLSSDNELYDDNSSKEIKTGVTLDVSSVFLLDNTDSPVEVEVSEAFSFGDAKLAKTFEIK